MKEQQPHGISGLQQKLDRIDGALGKANRVSQTIGKPEFGRPELDISPYSQLEGNAYLDAAIRVGRVRKALIENAIPKLNDSKGQTQKQIDDLKTQEEKARKLEEVKELIQVGYLPDYAFKRSQEILQTQATQTTGRKTIPKSVDGEPFLAVGRAAGTPPKVAADLNLDTNSIKKTLYMLLVEKVLGIDLAAYLKEEYEIKERSIRDILQDIRNKTNGEIRMSAKGVLGWLKICRINTRSKSEAIKLAWHDPAKREAVLARLATAKQVAAQALQAKFGDNPKEALENLYFKQGFSIQRVAEECGVSAWTVIKWLKMLEILHERGVVKPEAMDIFNRASTSGILTILEDREKQVLEERYNKGKSLSRIGLELGIPKSRAWFVESKALSKLRRQLYSLG